MLVIIILITNNLYSQSKTPYEKKREALQCEYFRALNIDELLILVAKKTGDWSIITNSQEYSYAVHSLNKNVFLTLTLVHLKELQEAAKLKNQLDFKKDAEILAEKKHKEEENQLAKRLLKEKEDMIQRLEKEKIDSVNKEYAYNKTDYMLIGNSIKEKFNHWLTKGEFETTVNYEVRINQNKKFVFDSICHSQIISTIQNKIEGYRIYFKLQPYNADKEYYPLIINVNDKDFINILNIKLSDAEEFKNNMQNATKITLPKEEENWCLIENNLYPLKVEVNKGVGEIKIPYTKKYSSLNYSSRGLNLANDIGELTYDFSGYQAKVTQQNVEKKENEFNEFIKKADELELNKEYIRCLEALKQANRILYKESLNSKIGLLENKIESIQKKYKEIQRVNLFISNKHENLEIISSGIFGALSQKNKKAGRNFQSAIQLIKTKFFDNNILPNGEFFKNELNLIWTDNEEMRLKASLEKERITNTWIAFNTEVLRLVYLNEINAVKKIENPQELIFSLTANKL